MPEYVEGASPILLLEWWKPAVGFEGLYEVSNVGNFRRVKHGPGTKRGHLRQQRNSRNGYYQVYPSVDGQNITVRVHVLVAATFIGPRPDGLVLDHLNGWKRKNWVSNLQYVSQAVNIARSICMGLSEPAFAAARANSPLTEDDVREIRRLAGTVSRAKLGKRFGVCAGSIRQIVAFETWKQVA